MSYGFHQWVTQQMLLNQIGEVAIFTRYLGFSPTLKTRYKNPFRLDKHAGCSFYVNKKNQLIFQDWASGEHSGTCFRIAQLYYRKSWRRTLWLIARDFGLVTSQGVLQTNQQSVPCFADTVAVSQLDYTPIVVRQKQWSLSDLAFWQMADQIVTEQQLSQQWVYPISAFWFDGYLKKDNLGDGNFAFCLQLPDKWQVYRTDLINREYRFRQSSSKWIIGLHRLDSRPYVLVTKSNADRVFLQLLGLNAVNVLSESWWPTPEQCAKLQQHGRQVIILFDNDEAGKKAAQKLAAAFGWLAIYYPSEWGKDTKQVCKQIGGQCVLTYLTQYLPG